jgi:serine/threonine protein kinase
MMKPDRAREEEIFDAACDIASASERAAFVARMCASDVEMQRRVEAMLEADEAARAFFNTQAAPSSPDTPAGADRAPSVEKAGDRIGRYRLLQQIGEGGMGVVYLAEQSEPVRRTVAFKIIKVGMDTREVVARFEAERQALALMDHPHIAKVLDAGATDSGRPFFVMELVRGVPITEYCDKNCLTPHQRLGLFVKVCQAVQHAHQKGIIHRDLKPSNILVTHNDGSAWPMIIDFGIAKATNQRLTEKTLFTRYAQLIGTPAYMSPEQAEMSKLEVDTRTDIYALGVLLYELLTGTTPFPSRELLSLGYREMQRTISEKEPPRPSTRLSTMAQEEKLVVARQRRLEPSSLEKLFRGDLDWIAMKCLEKDRTRRYETANGLAMDIQRHLQDEPVIARPPSQWYRFQKTFHRHRFAFITAALVFSLLLAAMLGVWNAARREARARLHEAAHRQAAEEALRRAEVSERVARQRTYASDMNLAQQALAGGDLGGALRLVSESATDLRGWEWRYLWRQTRSEARAKLNLAPGWLYCMRSSPDGRWLATMDAPTARIHV